MRVRQPDWCRAAKASRIEPLAKVARTLEKKQDLVLNWFRANAAISSGAVEGRNNKLKVSAAPTASAATT